MNQRLNIDPITGKRRLETVVNGEKSFVDEAGLLRKKEYLEASIQKFQTELDEVNTALENLYAIGK